MATKSTTKAGLYLRISKDAEGRSLGVKRQEQDARALCERRGWTVAKVFTDNDVSAYSGRRRPGYEKLLDALEGGDIGAVVAYHPDRLHRSPVELERFIEIVDGARAKVATVAAGEYDLGTASGRMVARVIGAVARAESERASERIRRKQRELAERGLPGGSGRPFGYKSDRVTIDKREAKLVRDAARGVLSGESLTSIARQWNERGIVTPRGKQWNATIVKAMLTGPRLAGLRVHQGVVHGKGVWEAIIDRATHERLNALLNDPARRRTRPPNRRLLTQLVRCGECGSKMTVDQGNGIRVFRCRKAPSLPNCGHVSIKHDAAEQIILEAVFARLDTPGLAAVAVQRDDTGDELLMAELSELESRLADAADAFAAGDVTRVEWLRVRDRIEARRAEVQAQITTSSRGEVFDGLDGHLRDAWPTLPVDRQREIIAAVLDKIVILPSSGPRRVFDPERIKYGWRA